MASDNNIFEVLQKVAENNSSSKKLTDILTENGYKGTLEDAGREIQKAEQVILENLTSDDLKNIAGGKILMNEKVKKAFATGTAALMAASAVPSQAATEANSNKHIKKNAVLDTIKSHPYHSVTTASLGISTVTMLAVSLILNSKLQAAKSKTNETAGDTINLEDAEKLLKGMPNGNILLDYLLLLANNNKPTDMLKLTASTDDEGKDPGKGDTIDETYVKVEAGEGAGNLCANQGILQLSKGEIVKLENLAVYLVYCSGKSKEPSGQNSLLETKTVQEPATDKKLTNYTFEVLTPNGKFLARLTAEIIMNTLEEKKKEEKKDVSEHTNENGDAQDATADSEETKKVKLELLQQILDFDFKQTEFKSVLRIKMYSDDKYEKPTTYDETGIEKTFIRFLQGTNKEIEPNKKKLLDEIFTWRGQTPQVIMHMFAYLKGDEAKNKESNAKESNAAGFPEIKKPEEGITGYTEAMFDEDTKNEITDLQKKIGEGYEKGNTEQAEDNIQE